MDRGYYIVNNGLPGRDSAQSLVPDSSGDSRSSRSRSLVDILVLEDNSGGSNPSTVSTAFASLNQDAEDYLNPIPVLADDRIYFSDSPTVSAPAAFYGCSTRFLPYVFSFGVVFLALLIAATRMLSAFGSRQSEEASISELLDKIPRSSLVEDRAVSEGLAIAYCFIIGSMSAFSEMFSVLEYFFPKPQAPVEGFVEVAPKQYSASLYFRVLALSAGNALITGGTTANGLLLFGGQKPNIGYYIGAISAGLIVFGSSTFFNARKQFKAYDEAGSSLELNTCKKVLFPLMIASGLITNGSTAIYQSLLLLTFFKVAPQVAFPLSLALGIISDWNLYYAQIPATKKLLSGAISSEATRSYLAPTLLANLIIYTAAGLTPFNTPQGLKDSAQVFTACITKMFNLPSSNWYDSSISTPVIWALGILLGSNAAYGLVAFRGGEVRGLINAANKRLVDILCSSGCCVPASQVDERQLLVPVRDQQGAAVFSSYGSSSASDPQLAHDGPVS